MTASRCAQSWQTARRSAFGAANAIEGDPSAHLLSPRLDLVKYSFLLYQRRLGLQHAFPYICLKLPMQNGKRVGRRVNF